MPTDLHCHLLPGLDDGPATIDDAVALAGALVAAGTRRVVATPHVSHRYGNTAETIADAAARLRVALAGRGMELELLTGAEVAAARLPDLEEADLRALTLGDGPWLLLEPPLAAEFAYERAVELVNAAGLRVLVAHPERCRLFQRDPSRLDALVAGGARLSITASSLTGSFGRPAQELALQLADRRLVANVASDAHDPWRRSPRLIDELQDAGFAQQATVWCNAFPDAVLGVPDSSAAGPTAAATAAPDDLPEPMQPLDVAGTMIAQGADPAEVERYLLARLPPALVVRNLRRLLREHRPT